MSDNPSLHQRLADAGAEFQSFHNFTAAAHFGDPNAEQAALNDDVALIDAGSRTQIALTGDDRAAFLHNMCTNEIRKLPVGGGCEAFLTNAQGRILAYVHVFCDPDRLILETVPGEAAAIIAHLDRYIIREQVELTDLADSRAELLLGGPGAMSLLADLIKEAVASGYLAHRALEISGLPVTVRRVELVGAGSYLLDCETSDAGELWRALTDAGATPCGELAADAARISAGIPAYGRDITDKNLPQEIGRDQQAISFTKGCYIGQETVARIDALGHVNRLLVRLKFAGGEVPEPGAELTSDGKEAGHATSAAYCPRQQSAMALAFVRTGSEVEGTLLASSVGNATVLPPVNLVE